MRSLAAALLLVLGTTLPAAAQSATDQSDSPDAAQAADVTAPSPEVEVAGVQTSADDARQPGESEPFIVNDGFGD